LQTKEGVPIAIPAHLNWGELVPAPDRKDRSTREENALGDLQHLVNLGLYLAKRHDGGTPAQGRIVVVIAVFSVEFSELRTAAGLQIRTSDASTNRTG
jgi:hypothetical protein